MTDRRAFLDAIIENPGDDTVRLVYADWLDENGSPSDRDRARLIRLQIQLHRDEDEDYDRHALLRESQELITRNRQEWAHGHEFVGFNHLDFQRGFLNRLTLVPRHLSDSAIDLLLAHEPVTNFTIALSVENVADCVRWRHLQRARRLRVIGTRYVHPPPREVQKAVLRSSFLSGVRALENWRRLDEEDLALIASDERFSRLGSLDLDSDRLGDRAVEVVARSPILSRLSALDLRQSAAALEILAASSLARRLTYLGFWRNDQTEGIRTVDAIADFPCLEVIRFGRRAGPGDEGAKCLAAMPTLVGLKRLELIKSGLGPRGAAAILTSPHLNQLEELDLSSNELGGGWVAAFAAIGPRRLRKLTLKNVQLDADAAVGLAESPGLNPLRELSLSGNPIGDRGAIALARSKQLSRLRRLDLRDCAISDEGALALAEAPILNRLKAMGWLDLGGNRYGEEAARRLEERLGSTPR